MTSLTKDISPREQSIACKLCRACKLPMPIDANKCTECSSVQNWRRYLDNSGIVLSLLVALTSLLTFVIPIWKSTIVAKRAEPTSALVEVDSTGYATFVVANGGNAPAVVEHIIFGSQDAVVRFNIESLSADKRTIRPNGINVFSARLHVENTVVGVWELVKIYRSTAGCEISVGVLTPDGNRRSTTVDSSTAGLTKQEDLAAGCFLKLRKLSVATLSHLGEKNDFRPTLCKVAELHPRDPNNKEVGSACKQ